MVLHHSNLCACRFRQSPGNIGFLRILASTNAKVVFAFVLLWLYLEVSLIVMIAREGAEYARLVLWLEFATAITGGLMIWRAWEKPAFQGQKLPHVGRLLKLWGRIRATYKTALNYPKLIAGALLIFPGLITDSIGILLVLRIFLSPMALRLGIRDEKPGIRARIRQLAGHMGGRSDGSSLAGKGRGMLAKVRSKIPDRASIASGLRAVSGKLSDLPIPGWVMNRLKKKRTDTQ